jgi:hypothetical protein
LTLQRNTIFWGRAASNVRCEDAGGPFRTVNFWQLIAKFRQHSVRATDERTGLPLVRNDGFIVQVLSGCKIRNFFAMLDHQITGLELNHCRSSGDLLFRHGYCNSLGGRPFRVALNS